MLKNQKVSWNPFNFHQELVLLRLQGPYLLRNIQRKDLPVELKLSPSVVRIVTSETTSFNDTTLYETFPWVDRCLVVE